MLTVLVVQDNEQYFYKLSNFFFLSSELLISLKTCQTPYLEMFYGHPSRWKLEDLFFRVAVVTASIWACSRSYLKDR